MKQPKDVQILTIVLNYRTAEMTLRAVEAALREMEGLAGAITVVDNDSGDGSYEILTQTAMDRGWLHRQPAGPPPRPCLRHSGAAFPAGGHRRHAAPAHSAAGRRAS